MTDEELIIAYKEGDRDSIDELIGRYKSAVSAAARSYFLAGASNEDLVQEGMIGLYKAIVNYDPTMGIPFSTFAPTCIKRSIYDAMKSAGRDKHKPLNMYVPYAEINEDSSVAASPEEITIDRESHSVLLNTINSLLTEKEKRVLSLYLNGNSYAEMATALGKDTKYIDNAIQRIKRKVRKITDGGK